MKLSKQDKELIEIATNIALQNSDIYQNKAMHVGCAIRTKSGNIYKGINLKTSHSVCAEQVAIGQAFANGEREFDTIVAVKMDEHGNTRVVSPCGLCRYIFDKLNIDINFLAEDLKKNKIVKVKIGDLLPYAYKR